MDTTVSDSDEHHTHATTGGAAAAGAVTGGVIGLTGGPIGAAIGAVGGAIVGAAAERMMHNDDDDTRVAHIEDSRDTRSTTLETGTARYEPGSTTMSTREGTFTREGSTLTPGPTDPTVTRGSASGTDEIVDR